MDDITNAWSVRIAEAGAPDEVDVAPAVTHAFIAGGKRRQELFLREEHGMIGGFGDVDVVAVFPWILNGIMVAAPILYSILSSGIVGACFSAVKDLLSITETLERRQKAQALPSNPYAPLKQSIDLLSTELDKAGIAPEQRDRIVFQVLRTLLEQPVGGAQFVQAVGGKK